MTDKEIEVSTPAIMAILFVGENEFYAGLGATREAALAALCEQPGAEGAEMIADKVDYLPIVERPSGWSVQTD